MRDVSRPDSPAPETIGPYRILDVLGSGGMGVVYRAQREGAGEIVAVKTVSGLKPERLRGLRSEIIALTGTTHPGLVRIIQHGVQRGLPWYAMDLVPGRSLSDYNDEIWQGFGVRNRRTADYSTVTPIVPSSGEIALDGALQPAQVLQRFPQPSAAAGRLREVLGIFRQLCQSLAYIHSRGFVHRDVKPSNVMIKPTGEPVLLDFGIAARALGAAGRESLETMSKALGTAPYLAPEQIRREFVDARADLYSVGCMLYETLTGLQPFRAGTLKELCRQHLDDSPQPLSELVGDLPAGLEPLILALLAKTKRDRVGHADELAHALESFTGGDQRATAAAPAVFLYRPELSGREEVLGELEGALTAASGNTGTLCLIGGESGVGKTFLASEVGRQAALRGMRVIGGECIPAGVSTVASLDIRGAALHPFRTLFESIADACTQTGPQLTERLLGPRLRVLEEYAPGLRGLATLAEHPAPPELGAEENLRRLLDDLKETLSVFVSTGPPLLLVLDDLQWADEVSIKFIQSLSSDWLRARPLVILGTYRSEEVTADLEKILKAPHVAKHALGRLGERSVGHAIADILGIATAPKAFVAFVAEQSEGNPFFVAEYLRAAVAERLISREQGAWTFAGGVSDEALARLPLPRSVQELVGRRLAGLGAEARNLLEHAAVFGREVDLGALLAVLKTDEHAAIPLVNELVGRQILESTPRAGYRFGHDKLREITYGAIDDDRRRRMHLAVAEAMEPRSSMPAPALPHAMLAHHFMQAQRWGKAVDYFEKAGDEALRTFSNREAVLYYTSAVDLNARLDGAPNALRVARWEKGLVDALLGLGEYVAGRAHGEACLRHCGMPLPSNVLGWTLGLLSHAARHVFQRLVPWSFPIRSQERAELLSLGSYVLNRLFEPLLFANLPLQATYCGLRNLNLAQRLPKSVPFARGYASMSIVAGMAAPLSGVARDWANRSVDLARSLEHDETLVYTLARSSCFFVTVAEWEEGEWRLREASQVAARIGDRRGYEEALSIEGLRLFFSGNLTASYECGSDLHASATRRGDHQTAIWGDNIQLQALVRLGRHDEALRILERLLPLVQREATDLDKVYAHGNFAATFARLGDLTQARAHSDLALQALGDRRPAAYFLLNGLSGAGDAYLAACRTTDVEARQEHADLRLALARTSRALKQLSQLMRFGRPADLLLRGLIEALHGDDRAALRTFRRGLSWAERLRMPYEEARIRLEIGRRVEGDEAQRQIRKAARLFGDLGALYDETIAETALKPSEQRLVS